MSDYPWWVIRIDESPLSSTCFTVYLYGSIVVVVVVVALCAAAWRTAAGNQYAFGQYWGQRELVAFALCAGIAWPLALSACACYFGWKALVELMLAIQARRER